MAEQPISGAQLKRLQTLWGLEWRRRCQTANLPELARDAASSRIVRITWAMGLLDRRVESFKELTAREAVKLLDELQKELPPEMLQRRRPDRRTAKSYGTAGRKNSKTDKTIDLIDAPTWRLINTLLEKVGWTRAQLDAFVLSPHGPKHLITLDHANKVIWAMKNMLRRAKRAAVQGSEGFTPSPTRGGIKPPLHEEVAAT